jgi:F-type H+-transporting ATPase subunit gamma
MTRRQELEHQIGVLGELKGIMTAMKNLALVEMRNLTRLRANHERVVATIARAAGDFLAHHPGVAPAAARGAGLLIMVGSERSFCGTFNEQVQDGAEEFLARHPAGLIAIGGKLASRLERDPRVVARLEGPSTADEVPAVLTRALECLAERQALQPDGSLELWAAYHDMDQGAVRVDEITAIRPRSGGEPEFPHPPLLNLPPRRFLVHLIEQQLFALLTRVFYSSLMAENRFRLAHMENATRRLENKAEEMTRQWNTLRQEEVTQEIAIILLSTQGPPDAETAPAKKAAPKPRRQE